MPDHRGYSYDECMAIPTSQTIGQALGRIPTGLYIVTTLQGQDPIGFVASFLMQIAFDPPGVCMAIAKERPHLEAIRRSGVFGVSILGESSSKLMAPFLRRTKEDPFGELRTSTAAGGVSRPAGYSRGFSYWASTVLKKDLMTSLPFTSHRMTWPWRMK